MKRIFPLLASAAPFLVILSALALALAWTLPSVRILVLNVAGSFDMISTEAGLDDPDIEVASVVCTQLLGQDQRAISDPVVQRLGARPAVALRCLEQAASADRARNSRATNPADDAPLKGAAAAEHPAEHESGLAAASDTTLVPLYALLGARLGERWMQELRDGEAESCSTATNARRALEYARMEPNHGLLSCAVGAPTETARRCCLEGLGGEDAFKALLSQPDLHPLGQAAPAFSAYVAAAFPGEPSAPEAPGGEADKKEEPAKNKQPSDSPAASKKSPEQQFGALQTSVQDWVVHVGCRLQNEDPNSLRVIQSFVTLVESPECAPTNPPSDGYYSTVNWSAMCRGIYDYRRWELNEPPRVAICHSLERTTLAQAVEGGRIGVNAALASAARLPGASPDMSSQFAATTYSRKKRRRAQPRSVIHTANGRKGTRVLNAFFRSIVAP